MDNEEILTYIKRAFELKKQGCYKQAVEMLYKALSIEPDSSEILYQLGDLYFLMGNYIRAIQYPEKILSEDENNLPALKLLMNISIKQNNFYSAKETAEKIYSLAEDEENLLSLIKIYGKLGLFDEVERHKEQIKGSAVCLYEYSKMLYDKGSVEDAEKYIDMAIKKDPDNEEFFAFKGEMYYIAGRLEDAKEIFDNFENNISNPKILNYKGLFEMDNMNFIEAVKYFSKAVSYDSKNAQYYYNLGNAYFLNGWHEEAINAYKNAIMYSPENSDYRFSLAYLYMGDENYDKASSETEIILEQNPKHPGANVIKGLLLYKKGNYVQAEKIIKANIDNGFDDDYTLCSLAYVESELGKYDLAEKHLNIVIGRNPNNNSHKCELCDLYTKSKEYLKAIEIADKIIESDENYVEAYISGGNAALASGKYDKLKTYAQGILAIDINYAAGYYFLALVRKEEEDYSEAIECMKRAILHDVGNAKYYYEMALLYELSGDNKSAFEYIKEAESIDNSEEYKILYKKLAALNRK